MRSTLLARSTLVVALLLLSACSGGGDPADPPRGWSERGIASWYGGKFHGRATASGEIYDMERISAAHKKLPFGTVVRVRNLDNGRSLDVRINDRGPFVRGRIIDLSRAAARELGMLEAGVARVRLTLVRKGRSSDHPAAATRPTQVWTVQVGAFRDRDRAERLAKVVAGDVAGARVYSSNGWHRVQFRGLANRAKADDLLRRLRAAGHSAVLTVED